MYSLMKNRVCLLALLAGVVLISVFYASIAYAFDAPTNAKFEPIGDGNVNTHTGDMALSIPLMTVPGRGGMGFPIVLNYASGIKLEQRAGPVGLGWGLNIPAVTRSVVGIPDDYSLSRDDAGNPSDNVWVYDNITTEAVYYEPVKEHKKDGFSTFMSIASLGLQIGMAIATSGASLGLSAAGGLGTTAGAIATTQATLSTAGSIRSLASSADLTNFNEKIDEIPPISHRGSYNGFYYVDIANVVYNNLLDFTTPDSFYLSSPVYSGPLIYGNDRIPGVGYILHAQVASGNIKDTVDDTHSSCASTNNPDDPNYNPFCPDPLKIETKIAPGIPDFMQITGFDITDRNGNTYKFMPVTKMTSSSFPAGQNPRSVSLSYAGEGPDNFVQFSQKTKFPNFDVTPATGNCGFNEKANYGEMMLLKPFYTVWGIYEITSQDPDNWIRFDYSDFNDATFGKVYSDGIPRGVRCSINPGGTTSYSETYSQSRFLRKIMSPTHEAHIIYGFDRKDMRESRSAASGDGDNRVPYIRKIVLTRAGVAYRTDGNYASGNIIKETDFTYSYELATFTPDNLDAYPNNGRLTPTKIDIYGNGGSPNKIPSIDFAYMASYYPYYNYRYFDRWGYYYLDGSNFNHNSAGGSYINPATWSLRKVTWPEGGTTEWEYEADRYVRVGNYYADAVPASGIGKDDTHYGGGLRVSKVTKTDGLGNSYVTKYLYTNTIDDLADGESDGWNSPSGGESSGVATSEPANSEGWEDSYFMVGGSPYSSPYVGYKTVYEINGYNEGGGTVSDKAPYGWTRYTYRTADEYPNTGFYEPPILFQHPDSPNRKYGFSFRRSKGIDHGGSDPYYPEKIIRSEKFPVLPIGEPVLIFGPPDTELKFVFKVSYSTDSGDFALGTKICKKTVRLPSTADNKCNTRDPNTLVCTEFVFTDCEVETYNNNIILTRYVETANGMDCGENDGKYQWAEWCGIMFDSTATPNDATSIARFVWARDAFVSFGTNDEGADGCGFGYDYTHAVPETLYRFSNVIDTGATRNLYDIQNSIGIGYGCPGNISIYKPPEYAALTCLDADNNNHCDYVELNDIDVLQKYSGAVDADYSRGILESVEHFDNSRNPTASIRNTVITLGRAAMQRNLDSTIVFPLIYWNTIDQIVSVRDGLETQTNNFYNVVNGLLRKRETTGSNDQVLKEETYFGGLNSIQNAQGGIYDEMRRNHRWGNSILSLAKNEYDQIVKESFTQWIEQGYAFYPWRVYEGKYVNGYGNERQKIAEYTDYDEYGNLYRMKKYLVSDFDLSNLEDRAGAKYNLLYNQYGDNDIQCNSQPDGGAHAGGGFAYSYLTCTYTCKDINSPGQNNCNSWLQEKAKYENTAQIKEITDTNSQTTTFAYDNLWRLDTATPPGESVWTVNYDYYYARDNGGISATNPNRVATTSVLDRSPLIEQKTASYFDGLGRGTQSAIASGSTTNRTNTHYNSRGLPETATDVFQSSVVWPNYDSAEPQNAYKSWSFYYNDPLGRIEKTYPLGSDPNGNSNFERVYPDDAGDGGYSSDATYDSTCLYGPVILPDAPEGENYRKFICSAAQDVKGTVKIRVGEKTGTVVSACIFDGSGNIGGTDAAHRKITYVRLPDISGYRDYYIETCKQNDATGNVIGELGSSYQGQTTYLERYKPPQPHSVINYGGDDDYSFTRGIDENGVSVVSHTDKLGRVVETDANNLVVNPGFELSTSAENSFWNGCTVGGEDCIQTGAQYNGIQGKYFKAYKLAWNTYQSDIPLKPNKAYIVSFYTKQGSGTVMARLKIVFDDNDYYYNPADGGEYFNCQGSTIYAQWTRVSCMFFTHENTQKITTLYAVTGSGAGEPDFTKYNYIDNIQIEPATPSGEATTPSQVLNEYDVAGRLLKTTMPNGQDIVYTYDTRGMIQTISHPDTDGLKDNDYDAAGNVIRATDPRGKVVGYDYDALNRLWGIDLDNSDEAPENEEIVYHYDDYTGIASCSLENTANGKGRLTAVEGNYLSDNHETVYYKYCYGYDEKSRLIEEKQYIGPVGPGQETYHITYTYNTAGSIKTITYPTDEVVEYAYNQKGQLTGATIPSGTVSYQYNPDSTLRLLSYPNGIATTYQYNPRKWVTEIRIGDFAGENPLFNHWKEQNVYDFAGNIIGIKDPVTYADSGFMYDNLYRLTGAYDAMSRFYRDLSYTYDTNGNRLTENSDYYQYSAEKKDRLTFKDPGPNSHFISYYYDANGNVVQETGGKELKFCSSTQDPLTAGSSPGDYWLLGVDAPVGTPVNIIYDNGTVRYEWNNLQVQYLQNTDRGCFVDTVSPEPRTGVQLTGTGNYKPSSTAWYDGNYIDNHFRIYPASGNYFTTDYYYDNENKLIQINNGGTCSKFIYDASGSRIEKLEPQKFDLTYDAMSSQLGAAGSIVQSIAIQPSGNNLFVLAKNPNALYKCASPKTSMSCTSMNLQGFTWNSPQAIAVDPTSENTLYITDSTNMKIYKVSVNANNAQVVYTFTFGEGQTNPTAQPYGIAVDSNGKVFVATKRTLPVDMTTIYKLSWNGNALVKESERESTPSGDMPSFLGISVGAAKTAAGERDKVYFTSYNRNGVIVYDNSLNPVWYSGTFTYPADADPDVYGYIYVAEASGGGNRIAKSDPQGKSIMEYATKYGPSGEYTFNSVMAVETITDQNGDYVFVADSGNRRIVRFKEAEKWQKTRYIRANGNVIQEDTYVMSGVDCSPPQGGQFLPPQQPSKPSGATGSFDLTKLGRALGKFVFDFFNTPVLANP